jgi:hypothetical protein
MVPFPMQGGPSILVLVASNRVVFLFNDFPEGIPCGGERKYCRFLYGPFLRVSIPPVLNMGDDLEEYKSNFSLSEKLSTEKYPSRRFNHLPTTYASISPSNNGIKI